MVAKPVPVRHDDAEDDDVDGELLEAEPVPDDAIVCRDYDRLTPAERIDTFQNRMRMLGEFRESEFIDDATFAWVARKLLADIGVSENARTRPDPDPTGAESCQATRANSENNTGKGTPPRARARKP